MCENLVLFPTVGQPLYCIQSIGRNVKNNLWTFSSDFHVLCYVSALWMPLRLCAIFCAFYSELWMSFTFNIRFISEAFSHCFDSGLQLWAQNKKISLKIKYNIIDTKIDWLYLYAELFQQQDVDHSIRNIFCAILLWIIMSSIWENNCIFIAMSVPLFGETLNLRLRFWD